MVPSDSNYITEKKPIWSYTLNPMDKPHGHGNINILMLELCADCIGIRRDMAFTQTFLTGVSLSEWRKGNIVPIQKKPTIKTLKISFQFLHFRFKVKFLKDWFLTKFLSFSPLINSSLKAIPVFIPASSKCYQLPTKYLHRSVSD